MELIGLATLNSVPPKHDDMQAVAFVPEMSHFHAQMGCIFADQLSIAILFFKGDLLFFKGALLFGKGHL
jgi:hypothetical protein